MGEDIDLEDIETRLYGQIYHGAPERIPSLLEIPVDVPPGGPEKIPSLLNIPIPVSGKVPNTTTRYYQNDTYIPLDSPFNKGRPRQFLNNVYINPNIQNQNNFGMPPRMPPFNSPRFQPNFNKQEARAQRLREKSKRKKERKRQKRDDVNLFNLAHLNNSIVNSNEQRQNSDSFVSGNEVICLSDDEDCVEIQEAHEKSSTPESECRDDDVIFVEPEPVPLINIEADEEKSESDTSNTSTVVLNSPTGSHNSEQNSNDFLESSMNESLNKSRFNSSTSLLNDFIKPSNPSEMYETESSCSTTDLSKDLANTLKAVVFNEVEFPRDDMFSGSNLDEFSNYITPQRSNARGKGKQKAVNVTPKQTKTKKSVIRESSSDSSSSESEYEQPINSRRELLIRNLPTLSPIVTQNSPVKKSTSNENYDNVNAIPNSAKKKRKKKNSENKEEAVVNATVDPVVGRKKKKLKKSQSADPNESNYSLNDSIASDQQLNYSASNEDTSISPVGNSRKRKKSKNFDEGQLNFEPSSSTGLPANLDSIITSTPTDNNKRRKRSKRSEGSSVVEDQSATKNNANLNTSESSKAKKKKRSETVLSEITPETVSENAPRDSSSSSDSTIEQHETTHLDSVEDNDESNELICNQTEATSDDMDDVILIEQPIETIDLIESTIDEIIQSQEVATSSKSSDVPLDFSSMEVVDEVGSSTVTDDGENDDEYDFADFEDVGNDLHLANCSHETRYSNCSNFDVEQLQSIMSDDPNDWKILATDRIQHYRKPGPRCGKCRDYGHSAMYCPTEISPPRCFLCGRVGHVESRCPHKLCTQCGNKGAFSTTFCYKCVNYRNTVCTICKMMGHGRNNCPDLWRRYYLTTEAGLLVTDDPLKMKSSDELWCCGCAQQGHLEHNCMYFNRAYPPTIPYIQSFDDIYQSKEKQTNPNVLHKERNIVVSEDTSGQTCNISIQITNAPILAPNPVNINSYGSSINHQNFNGQEQDFTQDVFDGFLFDSNDSFQQPQPQNHTKQGDPNAGMLKVLRKFNETDQMKVNMFEMHPGNNIQMFLKNEFKKLTQLSKMTGRGIRKLYHTYKGMHNLKPPLSAACFRKQLKVFQQVNMLVFGVHAFGMGKRHMATMSSFLMCKQFSNLTKEKRMSLCKAYFYIFGNQKQNSINYTKFLNIILSRVENGYGNR